MCPQYIGPYIIITCNQGGAYITCELDGTVLHRPVAAFRVIPYFSRATIYLPDGFIDIDSARVQELQGTTLTEDEENAEGIMDTPEGEDDE